jgi:hypothetical protein
MNRPLVKEVYGMLKKLFIISALLALVSLIIIWISCTATEGTNNNANADSTCDEVVANGCFNTGIGGWTVNANTTIESTTDSYYEKALNMSISGDNTSDRGFVSLNNIKNSGSNTKISFYLNSTLFDSKVGSGSISIRLGGDHYYNIGGGVLSDITVDAEKAASWVGFLDTKSSWRKVTLWNIDLISGLTDNKFEVLIAPGADNCTRFQIDEITFEE